MPLYSPRP